MKASADMQHHRTTLFTTASRPLALVLLALAVIGVAIAPYRIQAVNTGTVEWGAARNIVNNNANRAVLPSVAVDASDQLHIVYESKVGNADEDLMYQTSVDGQTFSAPVALATVSNTGAPYFKIAAGPNNRLHFVYSNLNRDSNTYYRQGTKNGTAVNWGPPVQLTTTGRTFNATLAVGPDGTVHVGWLTSLGDTDIVTYRSIAPSGALGPIEQPRTESVFQQNPQLAVTADGKPHMVFQRGLNATAEIFYARREGPNRWVTQNISSGGVASLNATIAADSANGVYIAWDENINGHDILFRRSTDGGQNFSGVVSFSGSPQFASFPSATFSAANGRVYVAWTDTTGEATGNSSTWVREFNPATGETGAAQKIDNRAGASDRPSIAVGTGRALVAWFDRATGQRQVFASVGTTDKTPGPVPTTGPVPTAGPTATPVPTGCSGTLTLENGRTSTNKTTISGAISVSNCTPTQMQVSVDRPPTDTTDKVAYSAALQVPIADASTRCGQRTVYVRLFDASGAGGSVFSTAITVDTAINAAVRAVNPNMTGLPSPYNPPQMADLASNGGASNGDPGFTRVRQFALVVNGEADCVGLRQVTIGESAPFTFTGSIASVFGLPGDKSAGAKTIPLVLTDALSNTMTMSPTVVYDPPLDDKSGLPVLAAANDPVDQTNANRVLRTFQISGINVTDNLYGTAPGGPQLARGSQFWGLWIANSRADIADPVNGADATALDWTPVGVSQPGGTVTVSNWSLFTGLDYNPTDTTRTGDYFIYVRFLDGAGNPSAGFRKFKVTLTAGYTIPRVYAPLVAR